MENWYISQAYPKLLRYKFLNSLDPIEQTAQFSLEIAEKSNKENSMEQKLAVLFLLEVLSTYLDILRIVSFVLIIVAFLAYESKAALFFHHVNPPKKQQNAVSM